MLRGGGSAAPARDSSSCSSLLSPSLSCASLFLPPSLFFFGSFSSLSSFAFLSLSFFALIAAGRCSRSLPACLPSLLRCIVDALSSSCT